MKSELSKANPVMGVNAGPACASDLAVDVPVYVGPASETDRSSQFAIQRSFSPTVLLRYRWSMLVSFLLLGTLSVAGIWASIARSYRATAKIEISPIVPQLLSDAKTDMYLPYESYRFSQVDHITGAEVLGAVVGRDAVRATNWYQAVPSTLLEDTLRRLGVQEKRPPLERLADALETDAPKGKQHIYVSLSTSTPGEAKVILDVVVEEYAKFANRRDADAELEKSTALQNEIRTRQRDLADLEKQAAQLRARLGTGSPEGLLEQKQLRLDQLSAQLRTVQAKYEIATRSSAEPSTTQPASTTAPAASFEDDEQWKRLQQELTVARRNLDMAETQYGPRHPSVVKLRKLVDFARTQLAAREDAFGSHGAVNAAPAGTGAHDLTVKQKVLTRTLSEEHKEFETTFRDAEELIQLNTLSAERIATLNELRQKLERIEMNRQVAGRIATWAAYESSAPEKDRLWPLTFAAIVGSLGASVGLAFLRVRNSPTVDTIADVPSILEPIFLGRLPLVRGADPAMLENAPGVSESVRIIRTALLNRLEPHHCKVIQVTSASPGSGKSTLTVMLGRSLAQIGKRVLVVDADVHRPVLAGHFAVADAPGLVDILTARIPAVAAICVTTLAKLSLLPAGRAAGLFDRELLANGAFSRLLQQQRGQYDFILLDSPPLLEMADSAILSRQADATILVVREQHCRHAAVRKALAVVDAAGGVVIGTVFVGSNAREDYGYGYEYGYGRARKSVPALPAEAPTDKGN